MSAAVLETGIFTVVSRDEKSITLCFSDASHPVFRAHFEDNPILPGFMQIDIVAALFKKRVTAITMAKFMKPIRPDETVTCHVTEGSKSTRILLKDADGKSVSDIKLQWETR
jgi:3-hydroxyacyl-[acyl-carrier-protein] dehydratase